MKKLIAFILIAVLVAASVPTVIWAAAPEAPAAEETAPFTDVPPGSWYEEAVLWAAENNITSGVGDHLFGPNQTVTRAQVVTMLWRIEDSPAAESTVTFSDVPDGKWYSDAVAWAAANELVAGYPNGTFAPGKDITRQELVTILFRYAKYKDPATAAPEDVDFSAYSDAGQIASFASDAMRWAVGTGVGHGTSDTTLSPNGTATRAQLVQMLYRWLAKPGEDDDPSSGGDWELPVIPNP